MPFSMELRVSGDTVAGEMISGAGKVPLTSGSWKDGALQLGFPYTGGEPVTMGAKLQDGKLVGVVDYNRGEATGTWTASQEVTAPRSVGQVRARPRCEGGVEIDDGDHAEAGAIADRESRVPDDDPPPAIRERQHFVARKAQPPADALHEGRRQCGAHGRVQGARARRPSARCPARVRRSR